MIKNEYCPYCQVVRGMVQTYFKGFEGKKVKVDVIEYHCQTCHRYVRTDYKVLVPDMKQSKEKGE